MYNEELELLIDAALADGVITDKEKRILFQKAQSLGINLDEFEMVLDARVVKMNKAESTETVKPAHKSNKYGDVRTCPQCGVRLPALTGICPECGYEIVGVNATSSAQKLAEAIDSITKTTTDIEEKWAKIADAVNSLPVPNTKEDLFEIAISMHSKMCDKVGGGGDEGARNAGAMLMTAYLNKYRECISKVKILYPTEAPFAGLLSTYNEDVKKAKKAIWRQEDHRVLWIMLGFAGVGVISFILSFLASIYSW